MWEAEWWDHCTNIHEMLECLRGRVNVKRRGRKLRLFACACCRLLWQDMETATRRAVEVAEQFADGLAGSRELARAREAAAAVLDAVRFSSESSRIRTCWAAWGVTWPPSGTKVEEDLQKAESIAHTPGLRFRRGARAALLREVVGNPFRRTRLAPDWLRWNDGTVVRLAVAGYDNRRLPEGTLEPVRLAVLADALEEAGCTDAHVLDHLRGPGPHVRGCWPLDLLTGKK